MATSPSRVDLGDDHWGDVAKAFRYRLPKADQVQPLFKEVAEERDLPFDMDVPVAYSIPSTDVQQALRRGGPGAASLMGTNASSGIVIPDGRRGKEALTVARLSVDTKRLPCPRLCGATFGPDGRLAVFGNGPVQRMWSWYSCSPASPHASRVEKPRLRTLHDLQNMAEAAKNAQWGQQSAGDAISVDSQQLEMGFFDGSDEDSTDTVEGETEDIVNLTTGKADDMYESYFGGFQRPLTQTTSGDERLVSKSGSDSGDSLGGPSADMLAPVVKVSNSFGGSVMHGQSRQLAMGWKLGNLVVQEKGRKDIGDTPIAAEAESLEADWRQKVALGLSPPRSCT
jgi:hypothetical protein